MYNNKKIFILGMARSGYEVAKLLSSANEILICDAKAQDSNNIKELESLGIKFVLTSEPEILLNETYDVVIKNPGVFPYHPCIKKAESLNIPVVNEMEVAYHYLNPETKIIGVTGSNGKTTTTTLIYEVLKSAGVNVILGGNIGTPLSAIAKKTTKDTVLLLEISDHQLNDLHDFKTDISIMTNLCPTHLDYHGSYEKYQSIKKKIFNHHDKSNIAIINASNQDSIELTKDINSTKIYFNDSHNYIKDNFIYINNEPVINTDNILLKGLHNYENILVMLVLLSNLNIDFKYALAVLKEFKGVEHRLEYVATINDVKYYNDSKSTNPVATITALKSFDGNIHLILGGMERSQDFNDLAPYASKIKKIYAIGEVRARIEEFAKKNKIPVYSCETLKLAMGNIQKNVAPNDIVLLSPASASWDQYAKFEDRGDEFKTIVNSLK